MGHGAGLAVLMPQEGGPKCPKCWLGACVGPARGAPAVGTSRRGLAPSVGCCGPTGSWPCLQVSGGLLISHHSTEPGTGQCVPVPCAGFSGYPTVAG